MLSGQSRLLKTQEIAPSNPHFAIEGQQQRMRSREALGEALCKALGEALCGTYAELSAGLSAELSAGLSAGLSANLTGHRQSSP